MQKPIFVKWTSASLRFKLEKEKKKKAGRPIVGSKPRDKRLEIRIDEDSLNKLEVERKRTGKTRAQIIIELIEQLDD